MILLFEERDNDCGVLIVSVNFILNAKN